MSIECAMLQDDFLETLVQGRVPVSIFLVNGIRLEGEIESHEQYGLLLRGISYLFIYKRSISTILPSRGPTTPALSAAEAPQTQLRPTTLRPRKPRRTRGS